MKKMSFVLGGEKSAAFFQYVGLLVFSYAALRVSLRALNNLGTFFLGTGRVNLKKYGSWAVVTGATDGIGKAYAEQLAKLGLNVVLVSRTLEKLREEATRLETQYKVQTKVIAVDFTEANSIYATLRNELSELDVAILVNNVGMSYPHPEYFDKIAENERLLNDLININIYSVTKMTAIILPGMVKRGGGVIVNNGSASGRIPTPLLTLYSATKAYVDFFSQSLNIEYKSKGIIVQSLSPYFVATKLSAMRPSLMAPTPNKFVSSALNTLSTQPVTNGCLLHNIQGWVMENLIPRTILDNITLSQMQGVRARALAKIKRQQEAAKKQ